MTEAGALLLRHAEAIVDRLDAARADMLALRAGETGSLRVGTYQSDRRPRPAGGDAPLPAPTGPGSSSGSPSRRPTRSSTARSRAATLDLAFCAAPLPDGPFESARADERPVRAPRPRRAPGGGPTSVSLADLERLALIGSSSCSSGLERRGDPARRAATPSSTRSARTTTARCRVSSPPASAPRSCRCSRSAPGDDRVRVVAPRAGRAAPRDLRRLASRPPSVAGRAGVRRDRAARSAPRSSASSPRRRSAAARATGRRERLEPLDHGRDRLALTDAHRRRGRSAPRADRARRGALR